MCQSGTIALTVMKSPDNSTSEAEDMTKLIIWARDRIRSLSQGKWSFSEQKMCDPARLRPRVPLRYTTSECAAKIMFLYL